MSWPPDGRLPLAQTIGGGWAGAGRRIVWLSPDLPEGITTMTTATETISAAATVEPRHMDAARDFIAAILAIDPVCRLLGEPHITVESERLWDRFIECYAAVVSGPYAKHGADALRIALSSL